MIPEDLECPLCEEQKIKKIADGFFYCKKCKIIFNQQHQSLSYDKDYFVREYKKQYKKTYIEDFENIYALSLKRLNRIFNFHKKKNPSSLLDIGSATGFFLKAAKDRGIKKLLGIEISKYASSYCSENFKIPVLQTHFDKAHISEKFDIISAWFFLEHCKNPATVIKKLYELLEEGGVLALAMPSYFGPLFIFNKKEWIATHPKDHKIDISPKGATKILKNAGFKKVKIYSCGFHPERIINEKSLLFKPFSIFYRYFTKITAYSDTVEIYAIK